jgi:hypothetical protein
VSFLFRYEIRHNSTWGIHIVELGDESGTPYRIHRNLASEAHAVAIAGELAACHRKSGQRCHVYNSVGQRKTA